MRAVTIGVIIVVMIVIMKSIARVDLVVVIHLNIVVESTIVGDVVVLKRTLGKLV